MRISHVLAAGVALGTAWPGILAGQLAVSDLRRIAEGTGVRDRPVVALGPAGYAVFWEEAPSPVPSTGRGPHYRIHRRDMAFDGVLRGTASVTVDEWGHQWAASAIATEGRSWLAYDFADQSMRTGDRDLALVSHPGFFVPPSTTLRVTEDLPTHPPVNQSSPALLFDPQSRQVILASSTGTYRGADRAWGAYDSMNIEIRVMDVDGVEQRRFTVEGPDHVGESITPALAILPPTWRERYVLAYASNAGHRDEGAAGYSIYLELYNRDWRVVGGRHLAHPVGGAARPSLATVDGKLYVSWVDNETNDVVVTELDQNLHPIWPMRLRAGLRETEFTSRFGEGAPGLGAPMLYDDRGGLGLAFIATWEYDAVEARARQEVFTSRIAYRGAARAGTGPTVERRGR